MRSVSLIVLIVLFSATAHSVSSVTVQWTPPTASTDGSALDDLAGYNVYYGTTSGHYSLMVDAGPATQVIISHLTPGQTYYFVATARDTSQNESPFSAEISYTVPMAPGDLTPPTVERTSIPPLATHVDAGVTLRVTFSEPMNPSTLTATTVQLRNAQGTLIPASVTYEAGIWTVSVDPAAVLADHTAYTLTITDARDQAGHLLPTYTLEFTTAPAPAPSLVAAYSFNAGTGTMVTDHSGFGHHGTRVGAAWTPRGKYGQALQFDGINDRVDISPTPALDLTSAMTLMAWVRPTVLRSWHTIILKEMPGDSPYYLYAHGASNRPLGGALIHGSVRNVIGPAPLPLNTWTHLATTYNGTVQRVVVNGITVAQREQTGPITTSSGMLRIGGNTIWPEFFQGRIDDVRVYNRALTDAEIVTDRHTPIQP